MVRISGSYLILLFGFVVQASHFRGGTITWKPMTNNISNGSTVSIMITQTFTWTKSAIACTSAMISTQSPLIDLSGRSGYGSLLMCIASCSTAGGYVGNEVPITGYCTDFSVALDLTVSQRSDIVNLTTGAHFVVAFGAGGGWQTLALGSSTGWSVSSTIDLRLRPDNGLINTPPVATCISYISIPANVQQAIQIPVLDADDDFIRCRFANGSSECLNTCPPTSLPSGTSLSSSCILTITGNTAGVYYLVALQVEDFITNTSTSPLSSVPLQFLIYVYTTPSCALKPLLLTSVSSDNNSSTCQGAQVGTNFTMTLTAVNRCGSGRTMSDIATLSFPIVIKSALVQSTTNTSLWSLKITWMPTANEVGSQVFCAVASDSASVQSDQYCMTFFVGLSSVPLCPGVTVAPTTTEQTSAIITNAVMTTQITSVIVSSTNATMMSTQQTLQDSTESATTAQLTSLSVAQTSDILIITPLSSSSSKNKSTNNINWLLIVGLSILALLLGLLFSVCCWYHLFGPGASRRRRKRSRDCINTTNERSPTGAQSYHKRSRVHQQQKYFEQQSNTTTSHSSTLRDAVMMPTVSARDKSFIAEQIQREVLETMSTPVDLCPILPIAQKKSVDTPKRLRLRNTSVEPQRSSLVIHATSQSRLASVAASPSLISKTEVSSQRSSTVVVSKIKRSSSSTRTDQHSSTVASRRNLNSVSVTNVKI